MTEDKIVGWHHWLNGYKFEQAQWDGEGQGILCAAVHRIAESHMTEQQPHKILINLKKRVKNDNSTVEKPVRYQLIQVTQVSGIRQIQLSSE